MLTHLVETRTGARSSCSGLCRTLAQTLASDSLTGERPADGGVSEATPSPAQLEPESTESLVSIKYKYKSLLPASHCTANRFPSFPLSLLHVLKATSDRVRREKADIKRRISRFSFGRW